MASKNFEINDLVWAKMKGFPHWPGKVTMPPADAKPKKNHHYIFFFGSKNFAWVADDFIQRHSESMVEKYSNRKSQLFRKAVDAIKNYSKDVNACTSVYPVVYLHRIDTLTGTCASKIKELNGANGKLLIANGEPLSRKNSPQDTKIAEKLVTPVKTSSRKDNSRKRTHSPDQNQMENLSVITENKESAFPFEDIFVVGPETAKKDVSTLDSEIVDKTKIIPTEKKIGFIGVSSEIGLGIVNKLYHSRHSIIVWSESDKWTESDECEMFAEQLNIKIAHTPADIAEEADIILCCVSDSDATKELIEKDCGVLEGMERCREKGKGFVGMSPTMDPKVSHEIATLISQKGGRYLEAPAYGSRIEADEGTLIIVAAGDNVLYRDCKSCFDSISKKHLFVSAEVGAAFKMNYIHN